MKKNLVLVFILLIVAAGIFAQEKYDGSNKNTIFFGLSAAGYERALNKSFSVGAEAGVDFLGVAYNIIISPLYVDAFASWYPWQKIFFVSLGLGYAGGGIATIKPEGDDEYTYGGFLVRPAVGWKIDIGKPGAWIFEIKTEVGMSFGGKYPLTTFSVPILFGRTF
jgi:hypothetical protein